MHLKLLHFIAFETAKFLRQLSMHFYFVFKHSFRRSGGRHRDDYDFTRQRRKTSSRSTNMNQSSNYIFGMKDFVSHNASHV